MNIVRKCTYLCQCVQSHFLFTRFNYPLIYGKIRVKVRFYFRDSREMGAWGPWIFTTTTPTTGLPTSVSLPFGTTSTFSSTRQPRMDISGAKNHSSIFHFEHFSTHGLAPLWLKSIDKPVVCYTLWVGPGQEDIWLQTLYLSESCCFQPSLQPISKWLHFSGLAQ